MRRHREIRKKENENTEAMRKRRGIVALGKCLRETLVTLQAELANDRDRLCWLEWYSAEDKTKPRVYRKADNKKRIVAKRIIVKVATICERMEWEHEEEEENNKDLRFYN